MDALPFRGTAFLNLVEAGVRSAIPNHVAGVDLIDQERADGRVGPLAAVDPGPLRAAWGR